jgi:hypothetical protein
MSKPIWVRVLVQLAMAIITLVVVGLLYAIYDYVVKSANDFDVHNLWDLAATPYALGLIYLGTGALVAALSAWWVGRPWDGLGGVALFAAAAAIIVALPDELAEPSTARWHKIGGVVFVTVLPLLGCALAAWPLQRPRQTREDGPPNAPPRLPDRPWEAN